MDYSEDYKLLVTSGYMPEAMLWIVNGTTRCKPFTLHDPDRPHLRGLVGVKVVENTPQVLSLDTGGLLKVWDIRRFGCVQSIKCERDVTKHEIERNPWHLLAYVPRTKQVRTMGW